MEREKAECQLKTNIPPFITVRYVRTSFLNKTRRAVLRQTKTRRKQQVWIMPFWFHAPFVFSPKRRKGGLQSPKRGHIPFLACWII